MCCSARALLSFKDFHPKKHKGVLALLGLEFVNKGYIEEIYGMSSYQFVPVRCLYSAVFHTRICS